MSATPPDDEQSPWSRPVVLISGAFILALILIGVIVAVTSGGGNHKSHTVAQTPPSTTSTTSTTSTGSTTTSTTSTSSTACNLPAGSQTTPSASPPAGTQWATVGSMQVPQAPKTLGPERQSGMWNTCFAHDPSGALLAAINFFGEGTGASATQTLQHLAAPPIPKAALGNDRLGGTGTIQLAGYKFQSYTSNQAVVLVALKGSKGALASIAATMIWRDGDWKLSVPSSGNLATEPIQDLTGYVQWSDF